ncbi:MAG: hypothetical protein C4584_01845 [Armatimonadetes bacterium]|nr:MAG: hypothetical protein C4584_01845 [Armatimonadota bacterium]
MWGDLPNKSTVAVFEFEEGSKLYFNDQRRFGWVKLYETSKIKDQKEDVLGKIGPEPFDPNWTWQQLKESLSKHPKMPIKVAIMDQSVVAGVGNIYASESLFLARIDPRKKAGSLSDEEYQKLYEGIKKSLEEAIRYGGSTIAHFVDANGKKGYFLDYANVYGKEGQPCRGCEGKVVKINLGGRGTYYCPACQK